MLPIQDWTIPPVSMVIETMRQLRVVQYDWISHQAECSASVKYRNDETGNEN